MKLKPCVRCGSTNVEISDCGYSSFNVGEAVCQACDYEVKVSPCGCCSPKEEIARAWNRERKRLITRVKKLRQEAAEIEGLLAGHS